jgi:hypothetical protein
MVEQAPRRQQRGAQDDRMQRQRHGHHPLQAGRLLHPIAKDIGDLH